MGWSQDQAIIRDALSVRKVLDSTSVRIIAERQKDENNQRPKSRPDLKAAVFNQGKNYEQWNAAMMDAMQNEQQSHRKRR